MPAPPTTDRLRRFWRLRFAARCGCGRQVEMRVHQVVADRGLSPDTTWAALGTRLRCGGCGAANPVIDLPGWAPDQATFADAYFPPN